MLRLLFLTQVVPYPPDSGPKIKTYHVLRYLAGQGHQITLASFIRDHEKPFLHHLRDYCQEIFVAPIHRSRIADGMAYFEGLRAGLPFLITRDAQPEMQHLIDRLAARQQFDIVHADQVTMAQYALRFRRLCDASAGSSPAIVFDAHNAVYEIVERARQTALPLLQPVLALEANRLKRYEGNLIDQFDHTLAVSEIDKTALQSAAVEKAKDTSRKNLASKISVIPIAVDCADLAIRKQKERTNDILAVSTLYYPPNADGIRWFMNQVFPMVRRRIPAATLTVVGARPPKDIIEFGARNAECVQVTGYVPDLQEYFERAAVMVVPVRAGSGMRVRILEALARGIPVVTTTTGVEGIDAVDGKHLLVADEPARFADAVARLLGDSNLRMSLSESGRRLVEERYDWRVVLPKLEAVYTLLRSG
jgi:glycosyltransferase involved in cell wall biosynthesis